MISDREAIGSLFVEKQHLLDEYRKLLGLVEQMSTGHIRQDQIVVDMEGLSWSLIPSAADAVEAQPDA